MNSKLLALLFVYNVFIVYGEDFLLKAKGPYKIFKKSVTWNKAKKACEKWKEGAHLAEIDSEQEHRRLQRKLERFIERNPNDCFEDNFWVGGHLDSTSSSEDNRIFKWQQTGEVISERWHEGEPNNWLDEGEDCVVYKKFSDRPTESFLLNDVPCTDYQLCFICEI